MGSTRGKSKKSQFGACPKIRNYKTGPSPPPTDQRYVTDHQTTLGEGGQVGGRRRSLCFFRNYFTQRQRIFGRATLVCPDIRFLSDRQSYSLAPPNGTTFELLHRQTYGRRIDDSTMADCGALPHETHDRNPQIAHG